MYLTIAQSLPGINSHNFFFVMDKVPREITQTELLLLHSACRLMLVDTCIKFREYSLSGFQVIEQTRFL